MKPLPRRLLPVLFLATAALLAARPACAEKPPEQEDFTGKFVCVEDAHNTWPLSGVRVVKIGSREFLAGEMLPPPPEPVVAPGGEIPADGKAKPPHKHHAKTPLVETPQADKAPAKPKHRRVLVALEEVVDVQVFDSAEDLNAYYDSLADGAGDDGNLSVN
jgi:hypothetical protein